MQGRTAAESWWSALIVWGVVNAINILQAAGYVTRVGTGGRAIDHLRGNAIVALAVPAAGALVAFWRAKASWRHGIGPAV